MMGHHPQLALNPIARSGPRIISPWSRAERGAQLPTNIRSRAMTHEAPSAERWSAVLQNLETQYGRIDRSPLPLGNKPDPYDELVYIVLTVMTRSQPRIDRAYEGLRALSGQDGWSGLLNVDEAELRRVLEPLGFVNRRTEQLLETVRRIETEHDGSLEALQDMEDQDALEFLVSLPGVGEKTAKCVLMYSLDRPVLPVDIHVLRVAKRLGFVETGASWEAASRQLEGDVPDELKFDVHVGFVIHGREICKGPNPQCSDCVLERECPSSHVASRLRATYSRA